tara:strand:- start:243 stop:593 length:351 start_codon:yes stop_codon:yes gene_type:complete
MKLTKTKLKQIIKESIRDFQGEWDPASNVPPESFGGGGDEVMKREALKNAADFYSIPLEELESALGAAMELTAEEVGETLTNALVQAHRTMPFDEKYGPGKEARIGEYVLRILRNE